MSDTGPGGRRLKWTPMPMNSQKNRKKIHIQSSSIKIIASHSVRKTIPSLLPVLAIVRIVFARSPKHVLNYSTCDFTFGPLA
jgi:hypothetical protein